MSDFKTYKSNTKRGGKELIIQWQGQSKSVTQWAELFGVSKTTLINRISKGWPPEKIMQGRVARTGPAGECKPRYRDYQRPEGDSPMRHARWI